MLDRAVPAPAGPGDARRGTDLAALGNRTDRSVYLLRDSIYYIEDSGARDLSISFTHMHNNLTRLDN